MDLELLLFPSDISNADAVNSFEHGMNSTSYMLDPLLACRIFFLHSPFHLLDDGDGPFGASAGRCDSTIAMDTTGQYGPIIRDFFHRHSPIPYLNVEVAYWNSASSRTDDSLETLADVIGNGCVIKIFNKEDDFDEHFPDRAIKEHMNLEGFLELYHNLKVEVAKRAIERGMFGTGTVNYGDFVGFLDDLPYKDAFEITTWANRSAGSGLLLACMPVKPIRRYHLESTSDYILRYNPLKERIDSVENPRDSAHKRQAHLFQAYDIRPSDLAIWVVYASGKYTPGTDHARMPSNRYIRVP